MAAKQSYKQIKRVFPKTDYGKVTLELAVGQEKVLIKDRQGIKLTLDRRDMEDNQHELVQACRKAEPEKFNAFLNELLEIDA